MTENSDCRSEDDGGQSRLKSRPQHLPFWRPGSGHFGQNLGSTSRNIIDDSQELLLSFIDSLHERTPCLFTLADYGTSDGYASIVFIRNIIGNLRIKHGENVAVQVIYEDQEGNDYNSLFKRICGESGYLSEFANVYPFASPINYYKRCVPDETCDVIFNCFTTHWLDPHDSIKLKNCVFDTSITEENVDSINHVREVAERNWTKFLLLRAQELKQGGLLIVLSLSAYDDHKHGGSACKQLKAADMGNKAASSLETDGVGVLDVYRDLEAAWRQLREEQIITQEEFEECTVNWAIRSAGEITAPFTAVASPVKEAGLEMLHHDQKVFPFHTKLAWRELQRQPIVAESPDNHRRYFARGLKQSHRVWSDASFRNSLSASRSETSKDAILDLLYDKFEALVASCEDPEIYNTDVIVSRLVVRKN